MAWMAVAAVLMSSVGVPVFQLAVATTSTLAAAFSSASEVRRLEDCSSAAMADTAFAMAAPSAGICASKCFTHTAPFTAWWLQRPPGRTWARLVK